MPEIKDDKLPICRKCKWLLVEETTFYIPSKRPVTTIDVICSLNDICIYGCDMCNDFEERQDDGLWDAKEIMNKYAKLYHYEVIDEE